MRPRACLSGACNTQPGAHCSTPRAAAAEGSAHVDWSLAQLMGQVHGHPCMRACAASVCHALQRESWQHTLWLAYSSLGVIYVRAWALLSAACHSSNS